jgi:hypothetical protein
MRWEIKGERNVTHAGKIMRAVAALVEVEGRHVFTRDQVRKRIGVTRDRWMAGYTAIFQAMREDQPGGAPPIGSKWKGAFRRVGHGEYVLTSRGRQLLREL